MDPKTLEVLTRISKNVPQHLQDNLTKIEIDDSEEQVARAALAADFISKAKKKKIQEALDAGRFRKQYTVINDETVAAIDKYYEEEIAKAIANGEIPDPKNDPWVQERLARKAQIMSIGTIKSIGGDVKPLETNPKVPTPPPAKKLKKKKKHGK